jgi:hypothetical protein
MSGRIKGIVLNILLPGSGFMAQQRWGWGFLYLIAAFTAALLTIWALGIGYLMVGIAAAIHSGAVGDAKHELSQKDIEKIAAASVAANAAVQKKIEEGSQ